MFGCPPGAVGARKFGSPCRPVAACAALWQRIRTDYNGLDASTEAFGASRPGGLRVRCPDAAVAGWLGWLARLAGWLGWLAG